MCLQSVGLRPARTIVFNTDPENELREFNLTLYEYYNLSPRLTVKYNTRAILEE